MDKINRRKARAIAGNISKEIYLVLAIMLLLAVFVAPARAAVSEGASLYEFNHASGQHFDLQAAYAGEKEDVSKPQNTEVQAGQSSKDVMLKGTYSAPVDEKDKVNMFMKGGVGVTATDTTNYSASDNTKVAPAFKFGLGLNYKF